MTANKTNSPGRPLSRAASHMRLSARDHHTSSTLIAWEGGAGGPSSLLHTTLEGPTEYVNARWMSSLHGFVCGIKWIMFHSYLEVGRTQNLETMVLRTLTAVGLFYFYHVWGPKRIEIHWNSIWLRAWSHMTSHYIEGPWLHYMILKVCWDGL